MATNPARPNYQDIIDEAWGDQVADHVIRRYRDTAERDADFVGVPPDELTGQMIAIIAGGQIPYLQQHDGTVWHAASPVLDVEQQGCIVKVSGSTFYRSDANGLCTVAFTQPFPHALDGVITSNATASDGGRWICHNYGPGMTPAVFVVIPVDLTGNGRANADFGFAWIAFGH
jgi:hypothetical protein